VAERVMGDHSAFDESDWLKTEKSQQNPKFLYEGEKVSVETWTKERKERSDRTYDRQ
jgi:hypothetical protein